VKDGGKSPSRFGKVKLQNLVIFSRQFATMIDAGVRVVKCLDILENQTKDPYLKPVLGQVKRDVTAGLSLTEAMAKHPRVFNKLYVNMIKAAEAGGILDHVLDRLATFLEKEMELRSKIKAAMMYPIVILVFSLIIVTALMIFVLPKFLDIFTQLGAPLPPTTKALFAISHFMTTNWWLLIAIPVGTVSFVKWYGNRPQGRMQIDGYKLKIPVVGELIQKMSIARFSRTFATLISDQDRQPLLDWLVSRFGPTTKPFPRTYVAQEITTFFSDNEAEALLNRACTRCHAIDRVNNARNSADAWRVVTIDMRERGAQLSDEEVEKLVEWLGRTKGTNANQ
jgi:type II secretory pathway component PulF